MNYQKFVQRWEEVTDLPPQTLGPWTRQYKWIAKQFKNMPWPVFFVLSVILVVALYFVLGSTIASLVTLLQRGF